METPRQTTEATTESPPNQPSKELTGEQRRLANLQSGIPAGCERGPDGKIRKKSRQPQIAEPEKEQTWVEAMDWALSHLSSNPEVAPSGKALELWLDGQENPKGFREKYLPNFLRGKPGQISGVPEWDGKSLCPTCGREPEPKDEGTARALAVAEQWMRENMA